MPLSDWFASIFSGAGGEREKFLFIICMNNSGSTLLERVIGDCRNAIGFPAPGGPDQQINGQAYVPDLMPIPGKMTPRCRRIWSEQAAIIGDEARYDWPRIKKRWRKEWAHNPKFQTAKPRVFLEKSPPNVLRAAMLQKNFANSFFILMHRNPYAVSEGIRRRTGISLERCIEHWLRCARKQMENEEVLQRAIRISYEQLCEQPELSRKQVVDFVPELDDLDVRKEVAVQSIEGHVRRPIGNYNDKQIALLSAEDLKTLNGFLDPASDVMQHFSYDYVRTAAQN